ncbi:hypothetical protein QP713_03810 [Neisseria mucosa]|uniref:Secreted protein n=1 Tax=Neisseria mucosa TaxID=488 RepID=A0AAW6ZCH8_NEIMU|nr:hypothetical protein [Neisseria mucosa]MDK6725924.1 hypothetical protein [Neisseria mucosa]MDK6870278.1 hypothetical protein [Neisseria mucosa]MDK8109926.1 hypothetical protein [Neisseria mucosa]MDK8361230.1 hypothetical protein [Neisseria mucosa]
MKFIFVLIPLITSSSTFAFNLILTKKQQKEKNAVIFFDLNRIFLHELTKNLAKKIKKHRTNGNHSSSNQQPKATNIKGRLKP